MTPGRPLSCSDDNCEGSWNMNTVVTSVATVRKEMKGTEVPNPQRSSACDCTCVLTRIDHCLMNNRIRVVDRQKDRQTHRQTHRPTTVTLAAHARRGLITITLSVFTQGRCCCPHRVCR